MSHVMLEFRYRFLLKSVLLTFIIFATALKNMLDLSNSDDRKPFCEQEVTGKK